MITRIQKINYATDFLFKKVMLYSRIVALKQYIGLTYIKPILLLFASVFFISACGGGVSEDTTAGSTPAPIPAPTPAPSPAPTPAPPPTPPANIAPNVNAGADQSVNEQTQVTLSGSATDSDGSVASYRWTQITGQSVTFVADTASTTFESPTTTTELMLTFQLTVTDNDDATTTDTVAVTVNPPSTATLNVTTDNDNNDLIVSWNDVSADVYRVLFWDNAGNVYGPTTTSLSLSITAAMRELGGSLVVEAYDALGNSVFSAPMNVENL
jgi:hypothetical protein